MVEGSLEMSADIAMILGNKARKEGLNDWEVIGRLGAGCTVKVSTQDKKSVFALTKEATISLNAEVGATGNVSAEASLEARVSSDN